MLGSGASENLLFEVKVKPITRTDAALGYIYHLKIYILLLFCFVRIFWSTNVDVFSQVALWNRPTCFLLLNRDIQLSDISLYIMLLGLPSENENNNLAISPTVHTGVYVTLLCPKIRLFCFSLMAISNKAGLSSCLTLCIIV